MSDAGRSRNWLFYVKDMVEFCERVRRYTDGQDQAAFVADSLRYDATIRNLELIGEAAANVPQSVRDAFPDIPWRAIVALRNRLIHGYSGIDNDIVWTIVRDAVPETLLALRHLLDTIDKDRSRTWTDHWH